MSDAIANSGPVREFVVDALAIKIFRTAQDLAGYAARMARSFLQVTLARQEGASVLFAAASSQVHSLNALAAFDDIEWSRVTMFHMDEYLGIDANHAASFRRFLSERILQRVKPKAFHFIQGDADQPLAECERYSTLLRKQPIDLCLLGIGENGHLAFNDPPVADFTDVHSIKLVKLDRACREQQVGEGHFPNIAAVPQYAYTLTIPALCAARNMICIVPEKRKARAVHDALRGPILPACPASFLRLQKQCTLLLDADSAGLI